MYDYTTIIEYSSIGLLLVTAALAAARRERYSWIPALLLLLPDLVVPASYLMYPPALIDAVAAINVLTLMLVRGSQYKGMDYALVSFMGLMTSYAMYVPPLGIGDAYFVLLLGIFMLVSVPVYFIIQLGGTRENLSAAVKAITALVIATVLYFTGASILFFALINQVGGLALLGYTFLILGMMLEVGAAPPCITGCRRVLGWQSIRRLHNSLHSQVRALHCHAEDSLPVGCQHGPALC